MSSNRQGESGNVFFTLFGAVALVGVIGVATTSLMRGPLGTVVSLNQKAKVESQLQIARKLVALDSAQRIDADCDGDGTIEPTRPNMVGECATLISGGGCLPSTVGAPKTDPWGTLVGYCAWDHAAAGGGLDQYNGVACGAGAGERQLLAGTTAGDRPVLAVISAGPNRTFETECGAGPVYVNRPAGSDDIVFEWTYEEAATGLGGGLWALMSGGGDAITTSKDIDISTDATFRSGTTAAFEGLADFRSGSVLDFGGGGLMLLPTDSNSGPCNAANRNMLRVDTTANRRVVQICHPAAEGGLGWTDVGGSGGAGSVAGAEGDIQMNSGGKLHASNLFNWDIDNNRLRVGTSSNSTNTLEVGGDTGITGLLSVTSAVRVGDGTEALPAYSFSSATGSGLYMDGGAIGVSVGGVNRMMISPSGASVVGDLTVTQNATVQNDLEVSNNARVGNNVDVGGVLFSSGSNALRIDDDLLVTGSSRFNGIGVFDSRVFVDNAVNATSFALDGGYDIPTNTITNGSTGMFSDNAGGINLSAGGSPRIHIESDGDVGIGLSGLPTTRLDVDGILRLRDTGRQAGDACGAPEGSLTYGTGDVLLVCSQQTGNWEVVGTSGGGGGGSSSMWRVMGSALQPQAVNSNYDFLFGGVTATGASGRYMMFDNSNGALRAGEVSGTQWSSANIGTNSAAFGYNVMAAGDSSIALGRSAIVGSGGAGSMAFGLGAPGGSSPQVSSSSSLGIFMGNQSGVNLNQSNVMLLAGGRMVINADAPAGGAQIVPGNNLGLTVYGNVGAFNFCNEEGIRCFTADDIASGATGAPGSDREIVFNSGGALGTHTDFVLSSDGNLGIGMNAPENRIDAIGAMRLRNAAGTTRFSFTTDGAIQLTHDEHAQIMLQGNGDGHQYSNLYFFGPGWTDRWDISHRQADGSLEYFYNGDALFEMTTDGRIGIGLLGVAVSNGTASGGQHLRLDVAGAIGGTHYCNENGTDCFTAADITSMANDQYWKAAADAGDIHYNSGNVGIGTNDPEHPLHVAGAMQIMPTPGKYLMMNEVGQLQLYGNDSATVQLQGDGDADGIYASVNLLQGDWVTGWGIIYNNVGNSLNFSRNGAGGGYRFKISDDGRVGINTDNALNSNGTAGGGQHLMLDVHGPIGGTHYCDQDGLNCFTPASLAAGGAAAGSNREIQFNSNGALSAMSGFVVNAAGQVGINNPNPETTLHIGVEAPSSYKPTVIISSASQPSVMMIHDDYDTGMIGISSNDYFSIASENSMEGIMFRVNGDYANNYLNSADIAARITTLGNMAVGSQAPQTRLDVGGTLKIASGGESCDTNRVGGIRYNAGQFQVCRTAGQPWESLTTASNAAAGSDRQIQFNSGGAMGASPNLYFSAEGDLAVLTTGDTFPSWITGNSQADMYVSGFVQGRGFAAQNDAGLTFGDGYAAIIGNSVENHLTFATDATRRMRIFADGRINIGNSGASDGTASGGQALRLDVDGPIGGTHYCDENGLNCFTPASVAAGNVAAGPNRSIQFNSGGQMEGVNSLSYITEGGGAFRFEVNNTDAHDQQFAQSLFRSNVAPTANQDISRYHVGLRSDIVVPPSNTRNVANLIAHLGFVDFDGSGNASTIEGVTGSVANYSSGGVFQLVGVAARSVVEAGEVELHTGLNIDTRTTAGTTVDNTYGIFLRANNANGTTTRRYGIYLNEPSGTVADDWGIYQEGAGQGNFFGGRMQMHNAVLMSGVLSPATLTANQNNYNPANLNNAAVLRLSASAPVSLTGLAGGSIGRLMNVVNVGSNAITLVSNSSSSDGGNRFAMAGDVVLAANQGAQLLYDATSFRWRVVSTSGTSAAGVTAAGGNRQIQFNSGGSLAASSVLRFGSEHGGRMLFEATNTGSDAAQTTQSTFITHIAPTANHNTSRTNTSLDAALHVLASNSQTLGNLTSFNSYLQLAGSGNIGHSSAVVGYVRGLSTGTVSSVSAASFYTDVASGTIGDVYAVYANPEIQGGTVTNLYGIHVNGAGAAPGSIANRYGVYLGVPGGAATVSDWGFYQAGTQTNYFGGAVQMNRAVQMSGVLSPAALSANQNNYAPANLAGAAVLRLNASAAVSLTGLTGGTAGRLMNVVNVGSNAITLVQNSTASDAANRFAMAGDIVLAANQGAQLLYDATSNRWRVVSTSGTSAAGVTAAGNNREIQFNSGGALSAASGMLYRTNGGGGLYARSTNTESSSGYVNQHDFYSFVQPAANFDNRSFTNLSGGLEVVSGNTRTIGEVTGVSGFTLLQGGGGIGYGKGVSGYVRNNATGAVTTIHGIFTGVETNSGSVANLVGQEVDAAINGGAVTNAIGVHISSRLTGGTIQNRYGILIEPATGTATNEWGIYQSGANQVNHFAGPTRMNNAVNMSGILSPASITAHQDNYSPAGIDTASVLRLTSSTPVYITGLTGGTAGRILNVINIGSNAITIVHQNGSSHQENRFATGNDIVLGNGQGVMLVYDGASNRWRAVGSTGSSSGSTIAAAGSNGQVQFNSGGNLTGAGSLYYSETGDGMLSLDATNTSTSAGYHNQAQFTVTVAPTANHTSGRDNVALYGEADVAPSNTRSIHALTATKGYTHLAGSGNIAHATGLHGYVRGMSTGTVGEIVGTVSGYEVSSGTVTEAIGTYIIGRATGGSVNRAFGLYVQMQNSASVANRYGIYLDPSSGNATNDYGFYQAGTELNVFGGPMRMANAVEMSGVVTATIAASQNNYNPANLASASVLRLTASAAGVNISGLQGGSSGRILHLMNVGGTHPITLLDDNSASGATNRFAMSGNITLAPRQGAMLVYDATDSRWRVMGSTGSSAAGTVAAGSTSDIQYNSGGTLAGSSVLQFRNDNGGRLVLEATNTATADGYFSQSSVRANVAPTANQTANRQLSAFGSTISVPLANTRNIGEVISNKAYMELYGSGNISRAIGINPWVSSNATGTHGTVAAISGGVGLDGATANEATGLNLDLSLTNSTLTTVHGIRVGLWSPGATTITNRYGVYIPAPSGSATNDWAFYQAGASQANYFAGDMQMNRAVVMSGAVSPASIGSSQNNYNPGSLATASVLRLTSSAAVNITGLQGGVAGRILHVMNIGANAITLVADDANSTAANRFAFSSNIVLAAEQGAMLVYDGASSRWRAVGSTGGGGAVTAAGSDRDIQFKSGAGLGASSNFQFQADGGGKLYHTATNTDIATGAFRQREFWTTVAPTANHAAGRGHDGLYSGMMINSSNARTIGGLSPLSGFLWLRGSGAVSNSSALYAYSQNASTGTVSQLTGSHNRVTSESGTVSWAAAVLAEATVSAGTVTRLAGLHSKLQHSGGTITHRYGLYIETPTGTATNDYGIYQGGTQPNYLRGNLGINVENPTVALAVSGDIEYTGTITDISDIRLKTDIKPLLDRGSMLERIAQIDTYSFRMKDDAKGRLEFGVMAQELEKLFPELVHTAQDEMGTKSVNYIGLIAPMITATRELQEENAVLKAEIAAMRTEREELAMTVSALAEDMKGLKAHTGYGIGKAGYGLLGLLAGLAAVFGMALVGRKRRMA